jgi:hypothetical protein
LDCEINPAHGMNIAIAFLQPFYFDEAHMVTLL